MNDTSESNSPEALRRQILDLVEQYHTATHPPQSFDPETSRAPVSGRVYNAADMQSLVDSSLDFWLTTGPYNEKFEARLGEFIGRKHVLTVNSGSSANLVALAGLTSHLHKDQALKPGDEFITCATGLATRCVITG